MRERTSCLRHYDLDVFLRAAHARGWDRRGAAFSVSVKIIGEYHGRPELLYEHIELRGLNNAIVVGSGPQMNLLAIQLLQTLDESCYSTHIMSVLAYYGIGLLGITTGECERFEVRQSR